MSTKVNLKKIFYSSVDGNGSEIDKVIDLGNVEVDVSKPTVIDVNDKVKLNKIFQAYDDPIASDKLTNPLTPVLGGASSLETKMKKMGKSKKGGKRRLRKSKKSKK
jgi:hypothetical protein